MAVWHLMLAARGKATRMVTYPGSPHSPTLWEQRHDVVREIAAWFKTSGVAFNSLHAPLFSDYDWGRDGSPPRSIRSTVTATGSICVSPCSSRAWIR